MCRISSTSLLASQHAFSCSRTVIAVRFVCERLPFGRYIAEAQNAALVPRSAENSANETDITAEIVPDMRSKPISAEKVSDSSSNAGKSGDSLEGYFGRAQWQWIVQVEHF